MIVNKIDAKIISIENMIRPVKIWMRPSLDWDHFDVLRVQKFFEIIPDCM